MIRIISEAIFCWLEREGTIPSEEQPLFEYAAYSMIFGMLPFVIITVLGVVFNMLQEGMIMVITFMLIRKFSGGYHLQSAKWCIPFSTLLLAGALGVIKMLINTGRIGWLSALVITSVLVICAFSPLDNEARQLTPKEKKGFKAIAIIISITELIIFFILLSRSLIQIAIPIGIGVELAAMLQLPCIIVNCRYCILLSSKIQTHKTNNV